MESQLGSLTAIYTTTEYAAGKCPKVGTIYRDAKTGKIYLFVKNTSATALTENMAAKITSLSGFEVQPNATLSNRKFAGIRPDGATSMTQNTYGWIQVLGAATGIYATDGGAATDGGMVQPSATTGSVTGVRSSPTTPFAKADVAIVIAASQTIIGTCYTSKTTSTEEVDLVICRNAWGIYN